jgi:hypothetical protein
VKEEHMRATPRWAVGLTFALLIIPGGIPSQAQTTNELRPPASFENIADQNARSRALFSEIAKVLNSPRCINCHPSGDRPTRAMTCIRISHPSGVRLVRAKRVTPIAITR